MSQPLDYYAENGLSAVFYDMLTALDRSLDGDLAFYADAIPLGSWVLEAGCGTGRIGLPLAEQGRAVVGLDLAPGMLMRAEARRAALQPEVRERTAFVQGDMTDFALNLTFDAVIAPFFGFSHLPLGAARERAFACFARHLNPGGLVVVHAVRGETIARPAEVDPQRAVLDIAFNDQGERIRLHVVEQSFDAAEGRFQQLLDYVVVDAGGDERRRTRERLQYFVGDLAEPALAAGLQVERKVSPFNGMGEMWMFRKPA